MDESRRLKRSADRQSLISDRDSLAEKIETRIQQDVLAGSGCIDRSLNRILGSVLRRVSNGSPRRIE